jgi:DNA repair protein RadC
MRRSKILLEDFETSNELSEVKVIYKSKQRPFVRITSSRDAYEFLVNLYDKDIIEYQEQFFMLLLNRANYVLGWIMLSQGGTSGTVVDPKIIFTLALITNANSFILAHNHPSGRIVPSEHDISLTKSISQSGKFLEISLLDHLILGHEGCYYSFADEGVI